MGASDQAIGRAETAARRELRKTFKAALKRQAKGTAWSAVQDALFRSFEGWFLSAPANVWLGQRRTRIELSCKPMALDPLFWEVVQVEANAQLPLSFRYTGAWICRTPPVVAYDIDELSRDPDALAADALMWLDRQVGQFKGWSVEQFLQQLQQHSRAGSYRATIITTLLLVQDYAAAEALCNEAIEQGDARGFGVSRESESIESFPELALAWLARKRGLFH
jgi:hypothetical protein